MSIRIEKAVLGGLAGTAAMTGVGLWIAPMMGIPRMNPAEMLASGMGGAVLGGWLAHLMIGIVLAVGYAVMSSHLPGSPVMRGVLYSLAPWLVAQLAVLPMMGMPLFSGAAVLAIGSLVGHMVYGSIVGVIYGTPARRTSPSLAGA